MDLMSSGATSFGVSGPSLGMPRERFPCVPAVWAFSKGGAPTDTTAAEPSPTIRLRLEKVELIVDPRPLESLCDEVLTSLMYIAHSNLPRFHNEGDRWSRISLAECH